MAEIHLNHWALVALCVEHIAYTLSPDRSDPGLNPARGPLLHVLPSISRIVLYISLYNKKNAKNKSFKK